MRYLAIILLFIFFNVYSQTENIYWDKNIPLENYISSAMIFATYGVVSMVNVAGCPEKAPTIIAISFSSILVEHTLIFYLRKKRHDIRNRNRRFHRIESGK